MSIPPSTTEPAATTAPVSLSGCTVGFLTLSVPDVKKAEHFYVQVLGLRVSRRHAPTRWLSLDVDETGGPGLGLMEDEEAADRPSPGITIDLTVPELDRLFAAIQAKVSVVHAPRHTPWGSYKAVIQDPFGHRIGLVLRS